MNRIARRGFVVFLLLGIVALLLSFNGGKRTNAAAKNASDDSTAKSAKRAQANPTFSKEVVRILQKNCQTCHHPGDIAPFSMMTFQETRPWAKAIREAVLVRKMPPWKPAPGCGEFRDARGLTQDEINTIVAWVDGGSPEGNPADLPVATEFPDGWPLGAPDFVAAPNEDFTPPQGQDTYRCFSVPVSALRGDRFIQGFDVRPGNRKIVHHVIAYPDPGGKSAALDDAEAGPGYTCFGGPGFDVSTSVADILAGKSYMLGGWAPGARGYFAPEGAGINMPGSANDRVVIQVHYHPTGEAETDRTSVGFYFAKVPVQKNLLLLPLVNDRFSIPAGAKGYEVSYTFDVPALLSGKILGVAPHMHLLGKQIKVELTRPNEPAQCLINVPSWDFNWQGSYLYQSPIAVPGGSSLKLTCTFDNSADNPLNPNNPPIAVKWGDRTTDEMALAFVAFTIDLFSVTPSTPQLTDVALDDTGALTVAGSGFQQAADIEINGRGVRDTRLEAGTISSRLASPELWKVYAAPGQTVNVAVINPDGVRTAPRSFTRPGTAKSLAAVSAANFSADSLAPDAIAAAFGTNLATTTLIATSTPLPTELAGTRVRVNGVPASLFFVAPGQINFLVPAGLQTGSAVIEIVAADGAISRGTVTLASAAPSLFTANASGTGAPAAVATKDGVNYIAVGNADGSANPVDTGDYLVLFGTGMRNASASAVKITLDGQPAAVQYAGAQGGFAGLDQLNTQIPPGVSGIVDVVVSINGKLANVVKVKVR